MKISNSKAKTFRRCQNQYKYKYVDKLEPRAKAVQLERGTWIHSLLEAHYDGEDWKAKHHELTIAFNNLFEEQREELGELPNECGRIMRAYLRHWAKADEDWIVVDTELNEYVTLPNGLVMNIVIDLVVESRRTGHLLAWDHKTRKNFENTENMVLDPQLTLYFDGMEIMGYKNLIGVGYNEIRTKAPTIPNLTAKTRQLERRLNIDTDVATYMREIRRYGFNPEDYALVLRHLARTQEGRFFKRTMLPKDPPMVKAMRRDLIATAQDIQRAEKRNAFPRNFMRECKWDCSFKDLCIAELHGADATTLIKTQFKRRGRVD